MTENSYRFSVGTIRCVAASDGTFTDPPGVFVANVPVERFEQELRDRGLPPHAVVSPDTCLYVDTGRHRVLIDTGAGFAPTNGKLVAHLAAEGIAPADVDTVILTHGHGDHIGGNADATGKVTFPNARSVMWRGEWEFWTEDEPDLDAMPADAHRKRLLVELAHAKLPPIQRHLELVEREAEIVPGLRAIAAPGHTAGHLAVSISSGTEQVRHLADTVFHPVLVEHPDWSSVVDLRAEQAAATRRLLLDRAAADRALVLAFHFPFPGLGHVIPHSNGWRWEPIEAHT
jgi:glyoxylase-like metal-dependent hydrolase (beta-lactamase superfamily II)